MNNYSKIRDHSMQFREVGIGVRSSMRCALCSRVHLNPDTIRKRNLGSGNVVVCKNGCVEGSDNA